MYTLQGKPNQHDTYITRSVRVWSQTIRISRGQRIATFYVVINMFEQIHYSWEEGLPTQPTTCRLTGPQVRISFSPRTAKESVEKSQAPIDGRLLGLSDPYHWYMVGTFNTCSRGPTHQSLTNTGGGCNHLRAPPSPRLSMKSLLFELKGDQAIILMSKSLHSTSTVSYHLSIAWDNDEPPK
jgi:hypothetical protein